MFEIKQTCMYSGSLSGSSRGFKKAGQSTCTHSLELHFVNECPWAARFRYVTFTFVFYILKLTSDDFQCPTLDRVVSK